MAAQLTSMNGSFALALNWCSARAIISLPVPFSPIMSTRALVDATFFTVFQYREDFRAFSHDLAGALGLLAQRYVLDEQFSLLQTVSYDQQDAVGVDRFLDEVVRAEASCLDSRLDGAVSPK